MISCFIWAIGVLVGFCFGCKYMKAKQIEEMRLESMRLEGMRRGK